MRLLAFLFILLATPAFALSLKAGDVLLQPMKCYLCTLIELQERTSFAHMGIVVRAGEKPLIAEAWGEVHVVALSKFLEKTDKTRPVRLIRLREQLDADLQVAMAPWVYAEYDSAFRWDNLGWGGREALYCSELVTKLLNPFLQNKIPTKSMDFSINYDDWYRYFRGDVPQGLPGNSPGDFERSPLFYPVGEWKNGIWTSL